MQQQQNNYIKFTTNEIIYPVQDFMTFRIKKGSNITKPTFAGVLSELEAAIRVCTPDYSELDEQEKEMAQKNIQKYVDNYNIYADIKADSFTIKKKNDQLDLEEYQNFLIDCCTNMQNHPYIAKMIEKDIVHEKSYKGILQVLVGMAEIRSRAYLDVDFEGLENHITQLNGPFKDPNVVELNEQVENHEPTKEELKKKSLKMDAFYQDDPHPGEFDIKGMVKNELKDRLKAEKENMELYPNLEKKPKDAKNLSDVLNTVYDNINKPVDKNNNNQLRDEIDSLVDGVPNSKAALDNFYDRFAGCTKAQFNELSEEKINQIKENGLYAHALNTYARLNEIHEKRGMFFWLFHPNQNKAEKQALAEMKDVLQNKFGVSKEELSPYRTSKDGQKYLYRPSSGDEIVEQIAINLNLEKSNKIIDINSERYTQIDRIKKGFFDEKKMDKKLLSEDDQFKLKKDTEEVNKSISKAHEKQEEKEMKKENSK